MGPLAKRVIHDKVIISRALCLAVKDVDEQEDDPMESMDACHVVSKEDMQAAAGRQKASHKAFGQLLRSKVPFA